MKKKQMTQTSGTDTTRGFIPHYNYKGVELQVKQKFPSDWYDKPGGHEHLLEYKRRPPVTDSGCIVYAMPGGGELISEVEL